MGYKNNFGPVKQLGYLVDDIDSAVKAWTEQQGVGPWLIIKNVPLQCEYKGQKTQPILHTAFAYVGDVQIELIQQTNDAPSPYLFYVQNQQFGLHHSAYLMEDVDAAVAEAQEHGHEIICDINMPDGGRYVYTNIPALGEHTFFEFLSATERMSEMFAQGIAAAKGWDGKGAPVVVDMAKLPTPK